MSEERKCRVCGCSEEKGCRTIDGCFWVESDLCSTCGDMLEHLYTFLTQAGPEDADPVEVISRLLGEIGIDDSAMPHPRSLIREIVAEYQAAEMIRRMNAGGGA